MPFLKCPTCAFGYSTEFADLGSRCPHCEIMLIGSDAQSAAGVEGYDLNSHYRCPRCGHGKWGDDPHVAAGCPHCNVSLTKVRGGERQSINESESGYSNDFIRAMELADKKTRTAWRWAIIGILFGLTGVGLVLTIICSLQAWNNHYEAVSLRRKWGQ